ncbi:MAG: FtsW/RodA/SpoVE family cell cycle protein [Clostridia bacterium]|nr:FtsW/RodA/SpoVE family cell cycle protein [Clostridia bacterium]
MKYCDKILWLIIILISSYSLLLVKSISRENFNYFTVQFLSVIIGIICACFLQVLNYKILVKFSKIIGIISVFLILCTLFLGIKIEGSMGVNARAWLALPGGITFQPSELVKIGFIITFSYHVSEIKKNNNFKKFKDIIYLGIHALVPVVLTHLQGDDGAAIIFFCIALVILFLSGLPIKYFVLLVFLLILVVPVLWKFVLVDYQKKRILTQFNPESDPLNMGYQQIQSMLSIGSGGILGQGIFNGPRVANNVVPVQESDFIFSVAGEELGFIGCALILLLILILIFRISYISKISQEITGTYICFGFIGLISMQSIFNLGMCLSLLPVMGVTLPFMSVGGSSVVCLFLGIGIIQNIYINRNQIQKNTNFEL